MTNGSIGIPSSYISWSITGSQNPFIFKDAASSKGVYWIFTIQTVAFFFKAIIGTFAEGFTVSDEPMHNKKSHKEACCKAMPKSAIGNFSPKYTIESMRSPPQFSHYLPV